jgi:hypothetical protein
MSFTHGYLLHMHVHIHTSLICHSIILLLLQNSVAASDFVFEVQLDLFMGLETISPELIPRFGLALALSREPFHDTTNTSDS